MTSRSIWNYEFALALESMKVRSTHRTGTEEIETQIQPSNPKREITNITNSHNTKENQLTVCTTRGERRLIGFRCHKASMKSKLIISFRMMHYLIKRVMSYFTD